MATRSAATDSATRNSTDKRLGALEQGQARLEVDFDGLRSDVQGLDRKFDHLADEMRVGFKAIGDERKTPWGIIATCFGVLLIVIGGVSSPYVNSLYTISQRLDKHETLEGHAVSLSRIGAVEARQSADFRILRERLVEVDTTLQREMRDLNDGLRHEMKSMYWKAKSERLGEEIERLKERRP